jgi:hypothetical protein
MFGSDAILALAAMLVMGQVTILAAARKQKRGALIAAGMLGGVAGAVIIVSGGVILEYSWSNSLIYASITMAAALILSFSASL